MHPRCSRRNIAATRGARTPRRQCPTYRLSHNVVRDGVRRPTTSSLIGAPALGVGANAQPQIQSPRR